MLSELNELFSPERTLFVQELESKKRVYDTLAELLSNRQYQLDKDTIFDYLIEREKLGSTTIGRGISIPRAKVPISQPYGAILVLKEGIHIETPDKLPATLFLALLLPETNTNQYSRLISELMVRTASRPVSEELAEITEPQIAINYFDTLLLSESAA